LDKDWGQASGVGRVKVGKVDEEAVGKKETGEFDGQDMK